MWFQIRFPIVCKAAYTCVHNNVFVVCINLTADDDWHRITWYVVTVDVVIIIVVVVVLVIIVIIAHSILWRPLHLIFLFQPPSSVCKPGGDLRQGHPRHDRHHDFLALRRVRILDVFEQPILQRTRRLSCCVLAHLRIQSTVTSSE